MIDPWWQEPAQNHDIQGKVSWRSPSNIALIKYWGKKPVQIPANASISFTLDKACTETSIRYRPRTGKGKWIHFWFEGKEAVAFADRIERFFISLGQIMPWLRSFEFEIDSCNSFPHSSGIASSASSMSALALCLCSIEQQHGPSLMKDDIFLQRASHIARLGSGSASRSVYPLMAAWGLSPHIDHSSDLHAIAVEDIDPIFHTYHDDILIVSESEKAVSSSQGHKLMDTNPFAPTRYQQADQNLGLLLKALKEGDVWAAGKIIEDEALSLHALMMCSDPSFILMKPETLAVIEAIRHYREEQKEPIFFTLDAGPNIHILYPGSTAEIARSFIWNELLSLVAQGRIIEDKVGAGPTRLSIP